MIYALLLTLLVGCSTQSDKSSPESPSHDTAESKSVEPVTALPEKGGCFPRQTEYSNESDAALFNGMLELRDGCLQGISGSESYLIIWPAGHTIDRSVTPHTVRDAEGKVVAEVGKMVTLGGGETKGLSPIDRTEKIEGLEGCCEGPYWVVGKVGA